MHLINLPKLSGIPANVTGILPLSALIDFTDPEQILHFYQLSGRGMMWNWVITPACARLLVSHDGTRTCYLDQGSAASPLFCLDGRWGDCYPCSNPSTIRACMGVAVKKKHPDSQPKPSHQKSNTPKSKPIRPQRLRIIQVSRAESKKGNPVWYKATVLVSGFVFLAALVTTILTELYKATLYLIVVLATGIVIRSSYGHCARLITKQEGPSYERLVVVADNFNEDDWTAFIGPNVLLNPLLNRPLQQIDPPKRRRLRRIQRLVYVLVAFQWILTIVVSGYQDWNAFVVFAWIALCALTSSFLYSEHFSTKSWLDSNELHLERVDVKLSSQRLMLSLLVALNPDTFKPNFSGLKWIDHLLAPSDDDRKKWQTALLGCLEVNGWNEKIEACNEKMKACTEKIEACNKNMACNEKMMACNDSGVLFYPCF